jgi:hypothetical protein
MGMAMRGWQGLTVVLSVVFVLALGAWVWRGTVNDAQNAYELRLYACRATADAAREPLKWDDARRNQKLEYIDEDEKHCEQFAPLERDTARAYFLLLTTIVLGIVGPVWFLGG